MTARLMTVECRRHGLKPKLGGSSMTDPSTKPYRFCKLQL